MIRGKYLSVFMLFALFGISNIQAEELQIDDYVLDFSDISTFDNKLQNVLSSSRPQIIIQVHGNLDINQLPERLGKWLAASDKQGGTVTVKTRSGYRKKSLDLWLKLRSYILSDDELLSQYGKIAGYDSEILYDEQGNISQIIFIRH